MYWNYEWIPEYFKDWDIIIHHSLTKDSGTVSWEAIRNYHKSLGWVDVGYHFGIERVNNSYQIFTGRPLGTVGAHTKEYGLNKRSIGICLVGNFDYEAPPEELYLITANLISGLCKTTRCNENEIHPHNKFNTAKTCPGRNFNMGKLTDKVKAILY